MAEFSLNEGSFVYGFVGRITKDKGIDELPQLINVFKGEISLVGPRPALPHQVNKYTKREKRRLEVKPGITGWL